jgi:hypothetical protein
VVLGNNCDDIITSVRVYPPSAFVSIIGGIINVKERIEGSTKLLLA